MALNASGWNCSKSRGRGAAGSDGRVKYKQEAMRQGEEYGFVTWDFLLRAGSECLSARRPPLAIRIAHLVANRLNREYQHISKHGSKVASSIVTK